MRRRGATRAGTRVALGGLLLAAAGVVVFSSALAATRTHTVGYVVAIRELGPGTVIGTGDTAVEKLDLGRPTAAVAFTDPALLAGRSLAVAITPGELIQSSMLRPVSGEPSLRPVSISVDPDSLVDLRAGDSVDVLAAPAGSGAAPTGPPPASTPGASAGPTEGTPAAGTNPSVTVVMRGASLLAIDRPGGGLTPAATSTTVVTVGVSDLAEAESLVEAAHDGTVMLVQAEPADGSGPGAGP